MHRPPRSCQFPSILAAASLVFLSAGTPSVFAQQAGPTRSLCQRVGGYDFIAKDTAFPRVATQPQLHRLFQGHSVDSQIKQRQLIVDALCKEMGGPCFYIGRPMKPLHEGRHITDSDWTEFMKIITGTLIELKLPRQEQREWVALFEKAFRPDIVEHASN